MYYSVLTTKNSVSIPHHTVDHLYQFHPHLPHPAPISPLLTTTLVSVSCVWWVRLGLFIYLFCLFFCIPHKSKIIWYFSFSIWLTSLSIIPSRSIHVVVANGKILPLYGQVIFHCIYTPYLLYPFSRWWTLALFPCLSWLL